MASGSSAAAVTVLTAAGLGWACRQQLARRRQGRSADVSLRELTKATLYDILRLKVAPSQQRFVASNAESVAEAHFNQQTAWFRGIYAGDTPVGFLMLSQQLDAASRGDAPHAAYYLWRLMIDASHQGRGYGRAAMLLLIEHVRSQPEGTELFTSFDPGGAEAFYASLGFVHTGRIIDGEIEMRLAIEPPPPRPRPLGRGEIAIRRATADDFAEILTVVNDAAVAYKGVVREYKEPYMPAEELRQDIEQAGIVFFVAELEGRPGLAGVMGIQSREVEDSTCPDVTLIRHAYTRSELQGRGVGTALLRALRRQTTRPVLIGTWAAGDWAVKFYENHGFSVIRDVEEKNRLLRTYWCDLPADEIVWSPVI